MEPAVSIRLTRQIQERRLGTAPELGVGTVIDLLYPWEIEAQGRVPAHPDVAYFNFSIEHRPYDQAEIDPRVDPWRFLADRFAEVVSDGVDEPRRTLEVIATSTRPTVFHCKSGRDRKGIVAAPVLSLLGVADGDIIADFALTELATDHLIADWRATHPGRELRWPSYGRAPADEPLAADRPPCLPIKGGRECPTCWC